MSEDRRNALIRLGQSLTESQMEDLVLVITTADVQGEWNWNGTDSVFEDDVAASLNALSREIRNACSGIIKEGDDDDDMA